MEWSNRRLSTVALNIKNIEVERLADEVADLAHETKTEAIRQALVERRMRLQARPGKPKGLRGYLERNVWPIMPTSELGLPCTCGARPRTVDR